MATQKVKPISLFFDITRVDEEKREVEAYAFVNEVVGGEGGMRLKRSAMEEASPDYMQWANIRRMHQQDAVGVCKSLVWDEKGAKKIIEVVDDDAWEKVKRGVYKGLSVGVQPTLMRGKDVEKCRWIETSLVDRPKDWDSKILAFRAEGITEETIEFDCEVEDEPIQRNEDLSDNADNERPDKVLRGQIESLRDDLIARLDAADELNYVDVNEFLDETIRGITSANAPARENLEGKSVKATTHYDCGADYGCCGHTKRGGAEECNEKRQRSFADAIAWHNKQIAELQQKRVEAGEIERVETEEDREKALTEVVTRAETAETERAELLTRAEKAESDLSAVREEFTAAEAEIKRLKDEPVKLNAPVRFFNPLERTFTMPEESQVAEDTKTKLKEYRLYYAELEAETDMAKRSDGIPKLMLMKNELAVMGINV